MTGGVSKLLKYKVDALAWLAANKLDILKGFFGSLLLPMMVALATTRYAQQQTESAKARNKSIVSFEDASGATFQASVASYVQDIIHRGRANALVVQRLSTNLISQNDSAQDISKYLPLRDKNLILEYQEHLSRLHVLLSRDNTVSSLRPFWEDVSETLVLRQRIKRDLGA